jgi:ASC-1-like (ASCH) protein
MFTLHLPERPFRAIQKGTKKIEGRSPDSKDNKYKKMKAGDILLFEHEKTGEKLETEILFVHHYPDTKSMLMAEGVENILSSKPKTIEHGIESYNSISDYKERILKFGIYAIGIKPIK